MCTVTFLPFENDDFILTSNRDVPFVRKKALPPQKYTHKGIQLIYPKDGEAGGTWIGSSEQKRLICLLNGGFKNHRRKPEYARSRGAIVLDLLIAHDIVQDCKTIDLTGIEPFTLVIVEWDFKLFLFEFVWDGVQKHMKILPLEPKIWSSSTLYSDAVKEQRQEWFSDWLQKNYASDRKNKPEVLQKSILDFHHRAGTGNPENDVLMQREHTGTVSITSVKKSGNSIDWKYEAVVQ